jgi:hypothetical protein
MSDDSNLNGRTTTVDEGEQWAFSHNLIPFAALSDELLIDLDAGEEFDSVALDLLTESGVEIIDLLVTTSKSGHQHVYIRLNHNMNELERVALQAMSGSDRRREAHSYNRIKRGSKTPTMLFETPDMAQEVVEWRKKRNP